MFNAYVRNVTTFVSISFATSVMAMAPALADQTMKFKLVTHSTGYVAMDPGDAVEGHIVGDAKFFGIMIFDDGQLGSVTYIAHYDYVKGNGPYSTYETVRFDDGSIIRFHNTGTAALNSGKTTFTNDKIDVLGGEGKYKGVTGHGIFSGIRIVPFADGGDSFFEGSFDLKSP